MQNIEVNVNDNSTDVNGPQDLLIIDDQHQHRYCRDEDDDLLVDDVGQAVRKIIRELQNDNISSGDDGDDGGCVNRLELEDGYLTDWFNSNPSANIAAFLDALRQNTTIQHVSVSGDFFLTISEMIEQRNDDNDDEEEEEERMEWQFLNVISRLPELITLEIREGMDFNGIALPVTQFQLLLRQATNLQILILRFVELEVPDNSVIVENDFDASISSLTRGADQHQTNNQILLEAFRHCPALQEVTFSQLRMGEGLDLETLFQGLAILPNLRQARIHMAVQRQQLHRRLRSSQRRQHNQDDIGRQARLQGICESNTLQLLELSSLQLLDEERMLQTLRTNTSIRNISLAEVEVSFSGWTELAQLFKRGVQDQQQENCGALECLRLDKMIGLDDDSMHVLCHALIPKSTASVPTLKQLQLCNILDMGRRGWRAISEMLTVNDSLTHLSLENCQGMDDDAVTGIASALKHNITLRHLEMQVFSGQLATPSYKKGRQALVDVLASGNNISLEHLFTRATGGQDVQLDFFLKLNRTGLRQYVLEQYHAQQSTVNQQEDAWCTEFMTTLIPYLDDLDVLFYVLQTNPAFVMSCFRLL